MEIPSLETMSRFTGLLVDIIVLIGAGFAVVKFQLFNVLGHRWRSDLTFAHHDLPDGSVIFTTDYEVKNSGERPLLMRKVTMRVTAARTEGSLLLPDETKVLAERTFSDENPRLKGLFQIEPGERTIFPLRAKFDSLDDAVFVLCDFTLVQKRTPGAYRGIYVKHGAKAKQKGGGD